MKKFIFAMFVALVATISFTSCDDTEKMSDNELSGKLLEYSVFKGLEGEDAATLTLLSATTYKLVYDDLGSYSEGTWEVIDGQLILTGQDGQNPNGIGEIAKEGKKLSIASGSLIFELEKQ
ncbi:MAG: hypothetical protein LBR81_01460 [Prevotellaceae bacterium]|jgi:hypothetical protein|nr:hypothetical protein [Prevotellaceae bacterium]